MFASEGGCAVKLVVKLSPSQVFWLWGTSFLLLGTYFVIIFAQMVVSEPRIVTIAMLLANIYLVYLGCYHLYWSVRFKRVKFKSFDEQLDELLDKPLPKVWK